MAFFLKQGRELHSTLPGVVDSVVDSVVNVDNTSKHWMLE